MLIPRCIGSAMAPKPAFVSTGITIRDAMRASRDGDLRRAVLNWVDRTGPYVEDDRLAEADDYFEYASLDITDSGLGEATRRIKAGDRAQTFSFEGGTIRFCDITAGGRSWSAGGAPRGLQCRECLDRR